MLRYRNSVGLSWIGFSLAPVLLGFLMSGCVIVPTSGVEEAPLAGKRVNEREIPALAAAGKSREEIISNLGKPPIALEDNGILVYPWIEHKGDYLILLFGASPSAGAAAVAATTFRQENWALLIAFDATDRVSHASLVELKPQDSINTTARIWAETHGLNIQPPQASFTLAPTPKYKSRVYIFRTKPPATLLTILGAGSWMWPVSIASNGLVKSELHDETVISLAVDPGQHEFVADALPSYRYVSRASLDIPPEKRRPASIKINTLPNQVYFIELLCTSGAGSIDTTLTSKTEAEALPIIREFRSAW